MKKNLKGFKMKYWKNKKRYLEKEKQYQAKNRLPYGACFGFLHNIFCLLCDHADLPVFLTASVKGICHSSVHTFSLGSAGFIWALHRDIIHFHWKRTVLYEICEVISYIFIEKKSFCMRSIRWYRTLSSKYDSFVWTKIPDIIQFLWKSHLLYEFSMGISYIFFKKSISCMNGAHIKTILRTAFAQTMGLLFYFVRDLRNSGSICCEYWSKE